MFERPVADEHELTTNKYDMCYMAYFKQYHVKNQHSTRNAANCKLLYSYIAIF